ncbi:TadE/TadG family type IV pilus assembly protein [Alteriqipengyuania sp. WL0013]|uniref:TadE family protein n=1 Tax=Alteriqipengyuania sp. WL0013 TaxID=3110773 RepID=UPI002B9E76C5|nr:TadE/TadG family type IV pilus assembly protein [Alteriqipengyuania sp. WL0013]MEB3414547.1 TadE/TadG family type IV pilus assembly protein [Alteriqipengyuania sp. WL0013]
MTKLTLSPLLRRLRRDEAGVGLLELALVAPILMLLCLGMVDVSRLVSAKIDLEQAAQRTTDFALSRRPTSNNGSYLVTEAAAAAGVPAKDVTVELFLECNGVKQTDFNTACPAGQAQARFASIAITRAVKTQFNWKAFANFGASRQEGSTTSVSVVGDSVVRFQ